ncbi:Actin-binding FH2 [Penicillium expansum]|uniref:Actin-binding FH2 n=1 Tax=Penicillium expansum TaxID=27334 RepID=A0A0A2JNK4_PENEN|nr:Actin-binding FH2 [Penicillium expansum]KGO57012.1 Actin-binding FH2 [Penicillium expansum]
MAETSADAPPPPPPPPPPPLPPKNNKQKKREWWPAIKKEKRERKNARRARIEAIFNALLNHYHEMGGSHPDAIHVLSELAKSLEEERHPHMHVKKG